MKKYFLYAATIAALFLVKENDEWKIAHHHASSAN